MRASAVLATSGVGRAAGLSPQLAADVAMLGARGGDARRVPLRVVVARTGGGPGLVPLLAGLRIADPPFDTDLLPVSVLHTAVDRPELRLAPAQSAALDRLARLLTARPELLGETLRASPGTVAWLRVRACEAGPFFRPDCAGTEAVTRTLRRCQDLTAAGPVSAALDTSVASVLSAPAVIRAPFRAFPLPWPTPGDSDRGSLCIEVVDLPVVAPDRAGPATGRALRRQALEVLHAAHLVLAVLPADELGGEARPSPAVEVLARLLDQVRRAPYAPPVVLVATVAGLRGRHGMADLGSWLRGRGGRTVGPAAEGLRVYALALPEAGLAARLLDGAVRRPGYTVRQAEADWAASGLAALSDGVLRPLIGEAPRRVPGLTVQRLLAACRDIRMGCLDLTDRHERPTPGPAAAPPPRESIRASESLGERDGRELWDHLEAFAASALAERTVRRLATKGARPHGD
ncbi:hypothetical protein O3Q52_15940 [Streptomyces sp. ActVer]|uniref:hypothetical protein n=1 Tax=Streptomyces sp. ActVer TaxID=3014558 RepID=UPI0022B37939|nr:hypothetical protein [Streptomyces sp. ActVer]MCZ4509661.1 hypothetical protein [Streptomyces sp. ActVer]